jgi:hypothetical protein
MPSYHRFTDIARPTTSINSKYVLRDDESPRTEPLPVRADRNTPKWIPAHTINTIMTHSTAGELNAAMLAFFVEKPQD